MSTGLRRTWAVVLATVTAYAFLTGALRAQQESVRPGVNKTFEDPNVDEFVGRFETESREIFAPRKEIVAACQLKPGMAVADVGAGTGLFTRLFAAEVGPQGRVYAVDIARKFVDHVEKTCSEAGLKNVTGVLCTSTSTELPPNSVDLVFVCDTYHHFEYPQKTLASIHQALRADGKLIVIDFHHIEGKTSKKMMEHVRAGQEVFTAEIEAAGFKKLDEASFLKENYFLRFQKTAAAAP
jgi:ubiquinone/menaquinone biosynthesis C-methylase UbiE